MQFKTTLSLKNRLANLQRVHLCRFDQENETTGQLATRPGNDQPIPDDGVELRITQTIDIKGRGPHLGRLLSSASEYAPSNRVLSAHTAASDTRLQQNRPNSNEYVVDWMERSLASLLQQAGRDTPPNSETQTIQENSEVQYTREGSVAVPTESYISHEIDIPLEDFAEAGSTFTREDRRHCVPNEGLIAAARRARQRLGRMKKKENDFALVGIDDSTTADTVKALLEQGADPNAILDKKDTSNSHLMAPALHSAICFQRSDCVELLLEFGANPNRGVKDSSPLMAAIEKNNAQITEILLNCQNLSVTDADKLWEKATQDSDPYILALLLKKKKRPRNRRHIISLCLKRIEASNNAAQVERMTFIMEVLFNCKDKEGEEDDSTEEWGALLHSAIILKRPENCPKGIRPRIIRGILLQDGVDRNFLSKCKPDLAEHTPLVCALIQERDALANSSNIEINDEVEKIVTLLLNLGARPYLTSLDLDTAIGVDMRRKSATLTETILTARAGASIKAIGTSRSIDDMMKDWTAYQRHIRTAIGHDNVQMLRFLVKHIPQIFRGTPIQVTAEELTNQAIGEGSLDIVTALLEGEAFPGLPTGLVADADKEGKKQLSPRVGASLYKAALTEKWDVLSYLLKTCDVSGIYAIDISHLGLSETEIQFKFPCEVVIPLAVMTAKAGKIELLDLIIDGASPDGGFHSPVVCSAFHAAVAGSNSDVVKHLFDKQSHTPALLTYVASREKWDMVEQLLGEALSVNEVAQLPGQGETWHALHRKGAPPLHYAVEWSNVRLVQLFVNKGAKLDEKYTLAEYYTCEKPVKNSEENFTLLHCAIEMYVRANERDKADNLLNIIKVFVSQGARANIDVRRGERFSELLGDYYQKKTVTAEELAKGSTPPLRHAYGLDWQTKLLDALVLNPLSVPVKKSIQATILKYSQRFKSYTPTNA